MNAFPDGETSSFGKSSSGDAAGSGAAAAAPEASMAVVDGVAPGAPVAPAMADAAPVAPVVDAAAAAAAAAAQEPAAAVAPAGGGELPVAADVAAVATVVDTAGEAVEAPPAEETEAPTVGLLVLAAELHPFCFQLSDGSWDGFMVELWAAIARQNGWPYTVKRAENVASLLDAIHDGRGAVGLGAISLTSKRQRSISFSLPTYQAGLMIMVPRRTETASMSTVLLSHQVWTAACLAVWSALLAGMFIHRVEHTQNAAFVRHRTYVKDLWEAVWWAGTTLATAGHSTMPITVCGRVFAMLLMFYGMIMVGFLSGTISSQLTLSKLQMGINGPDDLLSKTVATRVNSSSFWYCERRGIKVRGVKQIEFAYELLDNGAVDAVVYDAPALMYYAAREGSRFRLVPTQFEDQSYGFVVSRQRLDLLDDVDVTLLSMREDYRYETVINSWFGRNKDVFSDEHAEAGPRTMNWFLYGVTGALLFFAVAIYHLQMRKTASDRRVIRRIKHEHASSHKAHASGGAGEDDNDDEFFARFAPSDGDIGGLVHRGGGEYAHSSGAYVEQQPPMGDDQAVYTRVQMLETKLDALIDLMQRQQQQQARAE